MAKELLQNNILPRVFVSMSLVRRRSVSSSCVTLVLTVLVATTRAWTITTSSSRHGRYSVALGVGDARGEYYGESAGSYMVREFNTYEQLEEIVKLAAQPLPERPDGIVAVAKYSKASHPDCRATEAEYERLARNNPATIFLRCFDEYDNAHILLGQAGVTVWPTFDLFYGGNRVARVEGPHHVEVEELLKNYQFQNSKLDLFSENAVEPWGDGKVKDMTKTPRTTARFIPGYDWNSDKGFFDDAADKAQSDFEAQFGNWLPNTEDE